MPRLRYSDFPFGANIGLRVRYKSANGRHSKNGFGSGFTETLRAVTELAGDPIGVSEAGFRRK